MFSSAYDSSVTPFTFPEKSPDKKLIKKAAGATALDSPYQVFLNLQEPSNEYKDSLDHFQYNPHSYDERSQKIKEGKFIANELRPQDGVLYVGDQADKIFKKDAFFYWS
jgi:hypothetical protein